MVKNYRNSILWLVLLLCTCLSSCERMNDCTYWTEDCTMQTLWMEASPTTGERPENIKEYQLRLYPRTGDWGVYQEINLTEDIENIDIKGGNYDALMLFHPQYVSGENTYETLCLEYPEVDLGNPVVNTSVMLEPAIYVASKEELKIEETHRYFKSMVVKQVLKTFRWKICIDNVDDLPYKLDASVNGAGVRLLMRNQTIDNTLGAFLHLDLSKKGDTSVSNGKYRQTYVYEHHLLGFTETASLKLKVQTAESDIIELEVPVNELVSSYSEPVIDICLVADLENGTIKKSSSEEFEDDTIVNH